ncbi:MAG: SDR family oxidoreductase [Pseudomonadota bacterium]
MSEVQDLSGRKAVVTGAARGIGRAIAERLERAGASIVAIDRPGQMDDLPKAWQAIGIDLAEEGAGAALASVAAAHAQVDILVANAGVVPPWRGVAEIDRAEWQRVMAINTWAVAAALGAFVPSLSRSAHASAILMASIAGYKAHPKQVLYTASKHTVIGIMRCAALDLGAQGIRVNALAPGPVATDALLARLDARHAGGGPATDAALRALAQETALGRMASEEDVANAAHFLASDASAGMTGAVLPVEAGLA